MFTIFLTATAAAVSAVLGGLLLRPHREEPIKVPYAAVTVGVAAVALTALGLQMV